MMQRVRGLVALVNKGLSWEGKFELLRIEPAQDFKLIAPGVKHVGFLTDVIDSAYIQ